jgi:trehalose/maltose hydrolase-like predicted phosphorylase
VRIAGLGAVWQAVMLGFAGLDLMGDALGVAPKLPPQLPGQNVTREIIQHVRQHDGDRRR